MKMRFSKTLVAIAGILVVVCVVLVIALASNNSSSQTATVTPAQAAANSSSDSSDWRAIPFVNVRTGQSITLADYTGQTVVVEVVSIWCSNCLWQQQQAAQALTTLGDAAPVYISLDLDMGHLNDTAQTVADFAGFQQFPWTLALSNETLMRALIDEFGYNVLSAPISPIFTISPNGTTSKLHTGDLYPDDLIALINAASEQT